MVEELAASLNESDIVEGVVTRLMEYGAFVSLRSPDGGMHGAVVSTVLHFHVLECLPKEQVTTPWLRPYGAHVGPHGGALCR